MPELNTFPGVYFEVVDDSAYQLGAGSTTKIGLFADTIKGPGNEWVKVENWGQFVSKFGGLKTDATNTCYYGPQAAKTILGETNELWIYRLILNAGDSDDLLYPQTTEPSASGGFTFRLLHAGNQQPWEATNRPCYLIEASQIDLTKTGGAYLYDIYLYESDQFHDATNSGATDTLNNWTFNGKNIYSSDASSVKAKQIWKNISFLKDPTGGQAAIDAIGLYGGTLVSPDIAIEITSTSNWDNFNSEAEGLVDNIFIPASGVVTQAAVTQKAVFGKALGEGSRYAGTSRVLSNVEHFNAATFDDGLDIVLMPDAHLSAGTQADVITAWESLIDIAEEQGGIAVITTEDSGTVATLVGNNNAQAFNTSYAAIYTPWLKINNPDEGVIFNHPADGNVVKAMALTDRTQWPWFAPAGGVRGVLSNLALKRQFTEGQMTDLYNGNVNVLRNIPNVGPLIWGQKTMQKKRTSLDRVNVRRLMTYLRKKIKEYSAAFLFEPNDSTTWSKLKTQVDSLLDIVKTERGVYDYRVILDETTNTADVVDRNEMRGKIFLKPTKAAEVITMSFIIAGTGANFEE
jgi:phage tail sheath protein FI